MNGVRLLDRLVPFGEAEAIDWDAAYREELPRVYNFHRFRVFDHATAEDLTSLTFEKAWRARRRYRKSRASVSTWLIAIARNVATDHFRRRRDEVPLEGADAVDSATPEGEALRRSELRRLDVLVRALPDRERELIALKYGAELTNRAMAKLTGLSESNVGTILHRTVASLRAAWEEEDDRER